jgi:REP element-mobilizing transposase RayT
MARLLRFIPDNGSLVEVTTRTIQNRLLLTPTPQLNRIIIGALARAGRRYEVGVVAFSFLANHYHLLLQVQDADQLASFMTLFNLNSPAKWPGSPVGRTRSGPAATKPL